MSAGAVRGVGDRNADMELAELADVLPAETYSSNAAGADQEIARTSVEPPDSAAGSSPVQDLPASSSRQHSPKVSRPVSHLSVCIS